MFIVKFLMNIKAITRTKTAKAVTLGTDMVQCF